MITADETHSNIISLPHHHTNWYHNNSLSFGPHDQKLGLTGMPGGTEREAKERKGLNWPGKNSLPNFPMKIKVAPFVFTNH